MGLFNNAFLAIIGLLLSAYSIYVKKELEHATNDPDGEDFQALCDIEAIGASCSTVFSLPEGKMLSYFGLVPQGHILDVPNGFLGMLFYSYTLIRHYTGKLSLGRQLLFTTAVNILTSSLAIASSAFLARKLYIIREICVVCIATHFINTTLWIRGMREGLSETQKTTKSQ